MHRSTRRLPLWRLLWLVPIAVAVTSVTSVWYFVFAYVPQRRAEQVRGWTADLAAQAASRAAAIEAWAERETDEAALLASYPSVSSCLAGTRACDRHTRQVLAASAAALGYVGTVVMNGDFRVLLSTLPPADSLDVAAFRALVNQGRFADMVATAAGPLVVFGAAAAPAGPRGGRASGAVLVAVAPASRLFPLLEQPLRATTGEVVLVRIEGDSVRYLSPLRDRSVAPLSLVVPASRSAVGVSPAPRERGGGPDNPGRPVLAASRPIAGTPWTLVVSMDRQEALAGFNRRVTGMAVALALLLAALGGMALTTWWGVQRNNEAALARSRVRLAAILDHVRDTIMILDAEGRVRDANRQAEVLTGRTRGDLIGLQLAEDLQPRALRAEALAQRAQVLRDGEATFETRIVTAQGDEIPVEASVRVAELDDEPVMVSVVRDLSQLRAAEAHLERLNRILLTTSQINQLIVREEEQESVLGGACRVLVEYGAFRLAWIGEATPSGEVSPIASAGLTSYLDDISVRWDGGPLSEGPMGRALRLGRTAAFGSIEKDPAFEPWRAAAGRAGFGSCVATPIPGDGTRRRALCLYSAEAGEFDADIVALVEELAGDLGYALATIARREALAGAQAQVARSAAALEQAAEAAIITDPSGTILDVNPAFERITGYRRDEVIGQNPRVLKSGRQDTAFYKRMWDTLRRGEVFQGEVVNRTKDGALYTAEVVISPVRGADGRVVNYVGLQRDVTRERALDAQLRQSQKLEAVGQFTGGIAHDFNNLLSIVLANVSLATAELPGGAADIRGYLRDIEQATLRGSAMVRKLLAFGRRERLEVTAADLGVVTSELVQVLRRVVPESIEIRCDVAPSLPLARADVGAFEQIIVNLATNARDAMPGGGTLSLRVAHAAAGSLDEPLAGAPRAGYVVVSVSDTGCGMDAETQARIFEPFFTTKRAGQGTGLGLSMVFGLMQQHRGFIRVESARGVGTTFRLYFPAGAVAAEAAAPGAAPAVTAGHGETILLVEDEALVRRAATMILERRGYVVVSAQDGEEGWEKFVELGNAVALVMTDAIMPRLGGPELIARIRGSGRTVPCLMTSGYSDDATLDLPEGRPDAYVTKPWLPAELLRTVQALIARRPDAAATPV